MTALKSLHVIKNTYINSTKEKLQGDFSCKGREMIYKKKKNKNPEDMNISIFFNVKTSVSFDNTF